MRTEFFAAVLLIPSALWAGNDSSSDGVVPIGSNLQLFVDDYVVESLDGVTLELQSPRFAERVFEFDQPWEGNLSGYVTVFKDDDRYRMYYHGSSMALYVNRKLLEPGEEMIPDHPEFTCYAESPDGITWSRPSLGLYDFDGSKDNNIIFTEASITHNLTPFKDLRPGVPPEERYKALAGGPLVALRSADGIRWEKMQEKPVISDGAFDSQNVAFWDSARRRYVAVYRDFHHGLRSIKCATSSDFLEWTPGRWGDFGDAPTEHLYTNATTPYFRAPEVLLAFPKRFVPWRRLEPYYPHQGVSDAVFMSSRDGVNWDRRFMEAFVRPGREERNWIHRTNMIAKGLVPTGEGEMSLYISQHYTYPSAHLKRLVLRTDGLVSARADYAGGELITRPVTFQGGELLLNFATSAVGSIRVEIQDLHGNPLPGFSLDDSLPLFGDRLEHPVRWQRPAHADSWTDSGPLVMLGGKAVRLRFVMRDADLYSFRFQTREKKMKGGVGMRVDTFDRNRESWQTYDYNGGGGGKNNVFFMTTWERTGGLGNSGYIWADDSRWRIDTPEEPHSILPLILYNRWVALDTEDGSANETPRPTGLEEGDVLDLRGAEISVHLRGDDLDLKGARCYFWVAGAGTRWHYTGRLLRITQGEWGPPEHFILHNDESRWHRSWQGASLDEALKNSFSYGISFVGFSKEVTGKLSMEQFELRLASE